MIQNRYLSWLSVLVLWDKTNTNSTLASTWLHLTQLNWTKVRQSNSIPLSVITKEVGSCWLKKSQDVRCKMWEKENNNNNKNNNNNNNKNNNKDNKVRMKANYLKVIMAKNLFFGSLDHSKMHFCDLWMILHDLVTLPNVGKHLVLAQYAISSQSNSPDSRRWPKPSFLALWIIQKCISVT